MCSVVVATMFNSGGYYVFSSGGYYVFNSSGYYVSSSGGYYVFTSGATIYSITVVYTCSIVVVLYAQ